MRVVPTLLALATTALALPASDSYADASLVARKPGENLCSLKAPPKLCVPNKNITVAETAQRAYDFYRAFVVDGDAEKMFSLIDDVYVVSLVHIERGRGYGGLTWE